MDGGFYSADVRVKPGGDLPGTVKAIEDMGYRTHSGAKWFAAAKRDLYGVARKLHAQLWPNEPAPAVAAEAAVQRKVIERVKDELSKDHPKPDELVAAHARNLDELRAFITKNDLLRLPARETLTVEPMPAFKRGSSAAEYLAPGVLEKRKSWKATYYVDPIDPTWPPARPAGRGQLVTVSCDQPLRDEAGTNSSSAICRCSRSNGRTSSAARHPNPHMVETPTPGDTRRSAASRRRRALGTPSTGSFARASAVAGL